MEKLALCTDEVIVMGSRIGIQFICARFLYCSKISGTEFKINTISYLLMCSSGDKSNDCFAIKSSY